MIEIATKAVHSFIPPNDHPQYMDALMVSMRDLSIAKAIDGNIGIVPSGELAWQEAVRFNAENFLQTRLKEGLGHSSRSIILDTRYVPAESETHPDKRVVRPEIFFSETTVGYGGETAGVGETRGFPLPCGPAVVKTVHRLAVGMLIDGATLGDVVRVFDKTSQLFSENPNASSQDFIRTFRNLSPRGGYLSYSAFRYTSSVSR